MIKNEYTITRELMKRWAREDRFGNGVNILFFCMYVFTGAIGIAMLCLLFAVGGSGLHWYLAVFCIIFPAFRLTLVPYFAWTGKYKMMARTYGVDEWIRSAEFTDEEIIIKDHTSVMKFKYENVKELKEKGNEVRLVFNNRLLVIIYKDAFKNGSWEECRALIEAKTKTTD